MGQKVDFDALLKPTASTTGFSEYSVSKLCQVISTAYLAKKLAGTKITVFALHPGVVMTDIWRQVPVCIRCCFPCCMLNTKDGAVTSLYCCLSDQVLDKSGLYFDKCEVAAPNPLVNDEQLQLELWNRSLKWCNMEDPF